MVKNTKYKNNLTASKDQRALALLIKIDKANNNIRTVTVRSESSTRGYSCDLIVWLREPSDEDRKRMNQCIRMSPFTHNKKEATPTDNLAGPLASALQALIDSDINKLLTGKIDEAIKATWPGSPDAPIDDPVNHPKHYTSHPAKCECGKQIECIQIAEQMGFNLGNALKYLWRESLKGKSIEDLSKAAWYINREIEKRQKAIKSSDHY